jgi:hypothetical protein
MLESAVRGPPRHHEDTHDGSGRGGGGGVSTGGGVARYAGQQRVRPQRPLLHTEALPLRR